MECQIQSKIFNNKTKITRKKQFQIAEIFQTAQEAIVADLITQMAVVLSQRDLVKPLVAQVKVPQVKMAVHRYKKFLLGATNKRTMDAAKESSANSSI